MELGSGVASSLPMDVVGFFKNGRFPTSSEEYNIACHIQLLLTTAPDEFPPDPQYGCQLWELEFSTVQSTGMWMDRMAQHMKELVERYEKRLTDLEVNAELDQAEFKVKNGTNVTSRLKRRLNVALTARLARTNEPYRFKYSMLVAPFSLD